MPHAWWTPCGNARRGRCGQGAPLFAEVAVNSLEPMRPRSIGVEAVALHAFCQRARSAFVLTESSR
jgi:hypothetical protein